MVDLNSTHLVILIIGGALTILGTLTGWFAKFFSWVGTLLKRKPDTGTIHIPKKTVVLLPKQTRRPFWWHMGAQGKHPSMQIAGRLQATNITNGDVLLCGVKLRKPKTHGFILVQAPDNNMFGEHPILSGQVSEVMFDLWVQPPIKKVGELFKADVCIIDQFGNEHWLKKLEFIYQ